MCLEGELGEGLPAAGRQVPHGKGLGGSTARAPGPV